VCLAIALLAAGSCVTDALQADEALAKGDVTLIVG
jgi:hypothetical protein